MDSIAYGVSASFLILSSYFLACISVSDEDEDWNQLQDLKPDSR